MTLTSSLGEEREINDNTNCAARAQPQDGHRMMPILWRATPIGQANGYDIQVIEYEPVSGTRVDIDAPEPGDEPFTKFTDVTNGQSYKFRIR